MEKYKIRYGESFDFTIETDEDTAETATFLVGKEGQSPVIEVSANFVDGAAYIEVDPEETKVPLGSYKYQITIALSGSKVHKYTTDDDCDGNLPEFEVLEALDETEVS